MPGLNLSSHPSSDSYQFDQLSSKQLAVFDDLKLSIQSPDHYPYHERTQEGIYIYIEGHIFNVELEDVFLQVLNAIQSGAPEYIAEVVQNWDGEFIILAFDQSTQEIHLFNDMWARLPCYLHRNERGLTVSRNISYIVEQNSLQYNPFGIATYLLLGHTLGKTTLWRDVERIPPNTVVKINANSGNITIHSHLPAFNLEGNQSIEDISQELLTVFTEATINRVKQLHNPTLSFSGGLDSRLIAAVLNKANINIPYITYNRVDGADHKDHSSSLEVSKLLQKSASHEVMPLEDPSKTDNERLLHLKQGLNDLSMGYIIPFCQKHNERSQSMLTGNGAIFVKDLLPSTTISSTENLVEYIVKKHGSCSIHTAAKIASIESAQLKSHLMQEFSLYPYSNANHKYAFYKMREHAVNWAFEGEDRNRSFCASTTPFYHPKLIELCLSIPMKSKQYGQLFIPMFESLSPEVMSVDNPNWETSLEDQQKVKKVHFRQKIKQTIPDFILNMKYKKEMSEFHYSKEMYDLFNTWNHSNTLNTEAVPNKNKMNFYWQLFTLMKVINS